MRRQPVHGPVVVTREISDFGTIDLDTPRAEIRELARREGARHGLFQQTTVIPSKGRTLPLNYRAHFPSERVSKSTSLLRYVRQAVVESESLVGHRVLGQWQEQSARHADPPRAYTGSSRGVAPDDVLEVQDLGLAERLGDHHQVIDQFWKRGTCGDLI